MTELSLSVNILFYGLIALLQGLWYNAPATHIMAYRTTLNRKTRHQKIQASQRQAANPPISSGVNAMPQATPVPAGSQEQYAYVIQDLKKIGWITVICLILLLISTILISDFSIFVQLRSALHLPTL